MEKKKRGNQKGVRDVGARLTNKIIDSLETRSSKYFVWDSDVRGLGICVYPTGNKSFCLQYRNDRGQSRRMTIGTFPELRVRDARRIATKRRSEVNAGQDPVVERRKSRSTPTLAEFCERYLAEYAKIYKKPSTYKQNFYLVENHISKKLGHKRIDLVSFEDVQKLHVSMSEETPTQANHMVRLLSNIYTIAEKWGVYEGKNPCKNIRRNKESKRHYVLDSDELRRLFDELDDSDCSKIIKLLLFTGCRRDEIRKIQWSEVNFDLKILDLVDSKTGEKEVILNDKSIEILQSIERRNDSEYLFPSPVDARKAISYGSVHNYWCAIREKIGLKAVRLHDLRHTHAAYGLAAGLSLGATGQLLGHKRNETTMRYSEMLRESKLAASNLVASSLMQQLEKI